MALDAALLELTARELKQRLADARIDKIFEPTRDEVVLHLRTRTESHRLLVSARSGSARVCITQETFENPAAPPSFCMLLRKHFSGGRLVDVRVIPGERIAFFDFACTNEMGDSVCNTLAAELMGRYSNIVLVQGGKILDALKRVDFEASAVRQLLPGLPYTLPPKPNRPLLMQAPPQALAALADFRYAENISQLYNDIRITCANAFLAREGGAGPLALKLYHMPEELLSGYHADTQAMEDAGSLMTLEQVRGTLRTRPAQAYYEGLLDGFRAFANGQSSFDAMLASWAQTLYAYDEYLVFGRKYDNSKVRAIGQVVEQVLAHVLEQHGIQFPADSAAMITRGVYDMMKEQVWVARWEQANAGELQQCAAAVQGSMPQVYAIAQSVDALLSRNLNMAQEGCVRLVFLAAYIHEMDPGLHVPDTVGIIVSHGTSTASSMAHTVNQLLKSPVFTPFDMPLSSSEDEIVCRIRHFLHLRRFVRNLVVLVDMGSLEDVGLGLQGIGNLTRIRYRTGQTVKFWHDQCVTTANSGQCLVQTRSLPV